MMLYSFTGCMNKKSQDKCPKGSLIQCFRPAKPGKTNNQKNQQIEQHGDIEWLYFVKKTFKVDTVDVIWEISNKALMKLLYCLIEHICLVLPIRHR